MYIQNHQELLDHGDRELRGAVLDIAEHALSSVDPYQAVFRLIRRQGSKLVVGDRHYDLDRVGDVFVIGAGKATLRIAEALEDLLGSRISKGMIAVKRGQKHSLRYIRVIEASHPYPDASSQQAAIEALALARAAHAGDLVFTAITGGSSSLMSCPAEGMTLGEKREVHQLLLSCGANIREINAVRKHLSQIKGGLLAQAAARAELLNLTVSDVIGDPLDYICDLVVPDTSTVSDAIAVLRRYQLWDRVAASARAHLSRGEASETPKSMNSSKVHTFVLVPLAAGAEAAACRAGELGYLPLFLTSSLSGESREVGACLGSIAQEVVRTGRPVAPPCALVAAGETTVTIPADAGVGGPSQELSVSLALHLDGIGRVTALCLDTDGTDGPTTYAGGLVDSGTARAARARGRDVLGTLHAHDAGSLLSEVGDLVVTGATGTNVADLLLMVVGR
jgi:glycerate 2-kinase